MKCVYARHIPQVLRLQPANGGDGSIFMTVKLLTVQPGPDIGPATRLDRRPSCRMSVHF